MRGMAVIIWSLFAGFFIRLARICSQKHTSPLRIRIGYTNEVETKQQQGLLPFYIGVP